MIGNVIMSEPFWAPVMSCDLNTSSRVLTFWVFHETHTLTELFRLPSQLNLVASYLAPLTPNSGWVGTARLMPPITVPSLGERV